jgi:glucosamine--fructose-6-phosphate aminotransferase (isomerizing)
VPDPPLPPASEPKPPAGRARHPFYMYDMIRSQEVAARATLVSARAIARGIAAPPVSDPILFTGMGTSFHAALAGAHATALALDPLRPFEALPAFDFLLLPSEVPRFRHAVVYSSEGRTWFTIEALKRLGAAGARRVLVTGDPRSPAADLADHVVATQVAIETSWTHTVSYTTAQIATLALLEAWTAGGSGRALAELDRLPDAIGEAVALERRMLEAAEELSERERFLFLGSAGGGATPREAALKVQEATRRPAAGIGVEDFLHGPLPAVSETTAVVAVAHSVFERERARQALRAATTAGAATLLLDASGARSDTGAEIPVPAVAPPFAAAVDVIPLQWLTYWLAVGRGRNPDVMGLDDPRLLAARRTFGN